MLVPESENLKRYRKLAAEMLEIEKRWGLDSPEMDALLDKMDVVWWALTDDEIDLLNEGPDVGEHQIK